MRVKELKLALANTIETYNKSPRRTERVVGRIEAILSALEKSPVVDLVEHLQDARDFSLQTFGPGPRPDAVIAHIRKELEEISNQPHDLMEWIDVATLAFDGAMRMGYSPKQVAGALVKKLAINRLRNWPDWRKIPIGQPIEHIREEPPARKKTTRKLK